MIKTLHLTNYWHERSGGISTFYRQLLEAAIRHGRRMTLVVPGAQDEVCEVGPACRIYQVAAPPSPFNREYRTIYPREFLLPGSKIQQILTHERPDLVEICDKYSLIHLATLLRLRLARNLDFRPVVIGLSCERMDENFATYISRSGWGKAFTRFYMRHLYFPAFDQHIAVSENTAGELKDVAKGHVTTRGVWIRPMGVDIGHFSCGRRSPDLRQELLDRLSLSDEAILLLYVGRLAPEKNLELLIATMSELEKTKRNFRLIFVGDGVARRALEVLAQKQVPRKVEFLGHISDREELARIYANCDVFVHPNPTEPFGIAPLEAMASGLPLVAPDRGGVTFYANDGNAYLAPPTAAAFAEAVLRASTPTVEKDAKIRAARAAAEALSWSEVTSSFLQLYDVIYQLQTGRRPAQAASPAFVSSPANAVRAAALNSISTLAQTIFFAYTRAQGLSGPIQHGKHSQFQTKLEGMQTR